MTDQVIQARAPEVSSLRLPLVIVASLIALVAVIAGFRVSGVEIDAKTRVAFDAITGEAGFARGTLRGFARDRRARGIGPEAPLHLMGRADGRLTLFDPETGRVVDLESFGPVNAAVFKRFLNGVAPQKGAS
jgi:hypothetical protein